MNMISTGTFLNGMDASNKQSELVKKLVAAWEKKNTKAARAGGVSLMALSLAACGGDDTTPFAQSDIDAATAPLTAAVAAGEIALAAAQADAATAQADAAAALVAQSIAENQAADALVAQLTAENATAAANEAAAENAVALFAANAENAVALQAATDAQAAAVASLATANAALATANAALTAANADKAALQTQYDDINAKYLATQAPKDAEDLKATNSATPDNLIGGVGDDPFSGLAGTVAATDRFTDISTTDSDTLNITHSTDPGAFTATNIETIAVTVNNLGAITLDLANVTGANTVSYTRGDVLIGGATLPGNKAVAFANADSAGVGSLFAGAGTTTVDVSVAATDAAGLVLNFDNATGAITFDGASTVNAAASGDVRMNAVTNTGAAQTGKATVINAAAATRVDTHADLTGAITITAPAARDINVLDGQGGVTINAASTNTADSVVQVDDIDVSGATITVGTGVDDSTTAGNIGLDVTLRGTAAATDTATVSGAGHIELDIDGTASQQNVDALTLSGNGAAVVYDLAAPTTGTATSFTKAGTQTVTLMGDASEFSGVTITNIDTIDVIAGGNAAFNGSFFSGVGKVDLGVNNQNQAMTLVSGSTIEITADQTTGTNIDLSAAGGADMTIVAGDDIAGASVGTIELAAVNVAGGVAATTVGTVTIEASIANVDTTGVALAAKQNLVITGDENVVLSDTGGAETVLADSVSATNSTGNITINVEDTVANTPDVDTITTGSGADAIETDVGTGVVTVVSGGGIDTLTITAVGDTSSFNAGEGNDTINVDDVSNIVVLGGAGSDNFTTALNLGGTLVGGDGTDTLTIDGAGARTFAATFSMSGFSELDITASNNTVSMTGAQLANNSTLIIDGSGDDTFNVNSGSTAAAAKSVDLSNVTIKTGATLAGITVTGGAGVDTITGGTEAETFTQTVNDDTIAGGTGSGKVDKLTAIVTADAGTGVASVINMSAGTVSSTDILAKVSLRTVNSADSAAGTASTLFNDTLSTNNAAITTFSEIEHVVGTGGADYIVGTSGNDTIDGGAGNDYMSGGDGDDTFFAANGDVGVEGGNGVDTMSIAADASFVGNDFSGIEKIVTTVDDKEATLDAADIATLTNYSGVAGNAAETLQVTGTTGVDTVNLSTVTFANANTNTDLDNGADLFHFSATTDAVALGGTDGDLDTVFFKDTMGTNTVTEFVITEDKLSFKDVTAAGTLAEVAVSNGVADASFTVDGTNTTIYIINTDATDLDDNNTNDTIGNFTTMANVGAFLTNGVTTSNVAGEIHYFIINDATATAEYVYKFVDDGSDTVLDTNGSELTLLASITSDAAALTVADVLIA
jgi:hypothetical protein